MKWFALYVGIVVVSVGIRAYWIAAGAEFWPSVGMEVVQLGVLTIVFAGTVGALKANEKPE